MRRSGSGLFSRLARSSTMKSSADLERVFESAPRDDFGGAGGLPMEHAVTLRGLAHRYRERRGKRAGGDLDAILGDQPLGLADGGVRARGVALQVLDLPAVDAA